MLFPQNAGAAGATLELWAVDARTGAREALEPRETLTVADDGSWGPVKVNGQQAYELFVIREGFPATTSTSSRGCGAARWCG